MHVEISAELQYLLTTGVIRAYEAKDSLTGLYDPCWVRAAIGRLFRF